MDNLQRELCGIGRQKQAARKGRSRIGKVGVTVDSDTHNDLKIIEELIS